jgi:hypothetical protein
MSINTLTVKYFGTNVGKIYLSDVDMRGQLGGSDEANYIGGQNEYIVWGEVKVLYITDDVLYSYIKGVLKYFSTAGSSALFADGVHNGPPLTIVEGTDTLADEVPRQDIGATSCETGSYIPSGRTRFCDSYMAILADAKYSTGLAPVLTSSGTYTGGETGYFFGNDM